MSCSIVNDLSCYKYTTLSQSSVFVTSSLVFRVFVAKSTCDKSTGIVWARSWVLLPSGLLNLSLKQTRTQSSLIFFFSHGNMGRRSMRAKPFGKNGGKTIFFRSSLDASRTHQILPINHITDKRNDWVRVCLWSPMFVTNEYVCVLQERV